MIKEIGYCGGIENYARHMAGLGPGQTLYAAGLFSEDFLLFIDESHVTLPQLRICTPATEAANRCSSTTASACPAPDNRPCDW
jgi:excinuclease ABC subunit B